MRFGASLLGVVIAGCFITVSARPAQASTIIDLTGGGSGDANGAFYIWTNSQAIGSGAIDSFLRLQNGGDEQGYNHGLGFNAPWNTKPGAHDIQIEDLVVKNISGVDYFQFLLDVNESSGHDRELISLDNVQIFTRSTPITSPDEGFSHLGDPRFNNDAGVDGDTTVVIDYSLNSGSGGGDMFLYVPVSLFAGTLPSDYVYFYSLFSDSEAGFEEWGMLQNSNGAGPANSPVPEPGSMILMGTGLLFAAKKLRRRHSR